MLNAYYKKKVLSLVELVHNAGLYVVQKKDLKCLSEVSCDAYNGYPLHNWFMNGKYDVKISKLIMQMALKSMFGKGVIFADGEEINGFAVWMPPGFDGIKVSSLPFNETISLALSSRTGVIRKLVHYEDYAMGLKNKYTANRDWYLYNICVKKTSQGKGIASKLMQPVLQFLDMERNLAYLETNDKSNIGFYQHYGFDLMDEGTIPNSTVHHYAMVRKPANDF